MMRKYSILLVLLFFFCSGFAQKTVEEPVPVNSSVLTEAGFPTEGTYQIIVSDRRVIVDISDETLLSINSKRDNENITYIKVNEYVKIKILSFTTIKSKGFVPLKGYSYED